jgi:hypothetical protein
MTMRYFTQAQLILAAKIAEQRGYNRQLDAARIERFTRPTDLFAITFSMPHEHAAGVKVPLHMRCVIARPDGGSNQIDTDLDLFRQLAEVPTEDGARQSQHQDEEDAAYLAATR